jgi:hypothetical protein
VERFRRSRFGFGGVDPRVLFIPSCPGYTGLTGALDRSDRCNPRWVLAWVNVWVCSLLSCVAVVSSLGQFGGRLACLVLWGLSGLDRSNRCVSPVLTGVEPLSESCPVSPAGTGLTGGAHRSDRCWSVDSRFRIPLRSRVGRLCVGS